MKSIRPILFFLILPTCLPAQMEFKFSGYAVDLPGYQETRERLARFFNAEQSQFINLNRIRLRPSLSPWSGADLSFEYEITSLYHSSPLVLFDPQPSTFGRQLLNLRWTPVEESRLMLVHFIDRLYLRQNFSRASLILGRQRVSWGTGRIWNPTDLFNPINPASFGKIEKDGVDALSLRLYLGDFTDLTLVANPKERFRQTNSGFRLRSNFQEYDLSLIGGYFDGRVVVGVDFAGNFFDAGLRGEAILSYPRGDFNSNFVKYILGIDYQFTSQLYALLEFHFNGEGKADPLSYDLLRLSRGEILNLGRSFLALQASYLIDPLLTASAGSIMNLGDASKFLQGALSYSLMQDVFVSIGGQIFSAGEFDEFWYYPSSVFLKGEIYF